MIDLTPALPTFVITLREGVEAALVVGIVLAYLAKARQTRLNAWVYGGVGVGLLASGVVGFIFLVGLNAVGSTNQEYAPVLKPLLEGIFSMVAIAMLSWMLIWMTQQSRLLKQKIEGTVSSALADSTAGWGIFWLIFFAVLREGFETVLFIAAKFQQGVIPIVGTIAGIMVAVGIGVLLFQFSVKINLRLFFQAMGIFLLFIVAGLVLSALAHLDTGLAQLAEIQPSASLCFQLSSAQSSCILGPLLWDTSHWLPERQFPGILLHTLLGYEDQIYLVQAIAYSLFLISVGNIYLQSITGWSSSATKKQTSA